MQMSSFSTLKTLAPLFCSLALVACGPPDPVAATPIEGPFIVSQYFTPSGLMGDGAIPGRVSEGINENCKTPRPAGAQGDCYHFLYEVGDVKWAGAFWVYPSNSWGTVPGRAVVGPIDLGPDGMGHELHGYHHVRFWAAIDPLPNAPFLQYFVGGIGGPDSSPPEPYQDTGCTVSAAATPGAPATVDCSTIFKAVDGGRLTTDWKQFTLDFTTPFSNQSVSSLIGAFGWSSNDTDNPGMTQSIYIDDIVWE